MLEGLRKLLGNVQLQGKAVAAQLNPNDNGANYNTVRYQNYQNGALTPRQTNDASLVYTNQGMTRPMGSVSHDTTGRAVQWQDPKTGYSPTGYISPEYQRSADAWAKKGKWGGFGSLF